MMKKVLFFLAAAIIIGCSIPEKLGLPSWTTTLRLYILNDTYQIADLAEEDSTLVAFGDTLGFYETFYESGNVDFSTEAVYEEDATEIGDIEIDSPEPVYTYVPLSEMAPDLENGFIPEPGIEPFDLPTILKDDVEPFGEFEYASLVSGVMQLSLLNNTVIWLGDVANGNPFILKILDFNDNVILEHIFIEDIPPNAAAVITEYEDLAGVIMENDIKVELNGGSRGTDGASATVNIDDELEVEVSIFDIVADEALAQIPAQDFSDETYITLDDSITIYEAILSNNNNRLTIDIANSIDLEITANIQIANIWLNGETTAFQHEILIPPSEGGVSHITELIDLNGAILGDGSEPIDSLLVTIEAITTDTGDEYRHANSNDFFEVLMSVSELDFEYLSGILRPREQEEIMGSSIIEVEYPFINGSFEVTGYSEIIFDVFSPVPAEMAIDISSHNNAGDVVYLREYGSSELPVLNVSQGLSQVIFNTQDYSINELISILPDSISYKIYPILGDLNDMFEYNQGDSIMADITIESRLDILADCWLIPKTDEGKPDVQTVDVEDFEQEHIDAFQNAVLTLNYYNALGVSTAAKILISDHKAEAFNELVNPDSTLYKIIDVPQLVQSANNEFDQLQVNILQDDLEYFIADSVFVIPKIQLLSNAGTPLSGYITVQAKVEVEVEVSNDLVD